MKKNIKLILKHKKKIIILVTCVAALIAAYFVFQNSETKGSTSMFAVVDIVKKGSVSSGINTTGTIVAAHKLNLDVYKQAKRIEYVNVVNGGSVKEGETIYSFDKSSARVDAQTSEVQVLEAKLALEKQKKEITEENLTIKTIAQQIVDLQESLKQVEKDKITALKDYLNEGLEAQPVDERDLPRDKPTISGYYNSTEQGVYKISVYKSATESGYSFRVSGIESDTQSVYLNKSIKFGTRGLEIKFPLDISQGDEWEISIPNKESSFYQNRTDSYNKKITDLETKYKNSEIELLNKQKGLGDEEYDSAVYYKDLALAKVKAELAQAQVKSSESYDVVRDQDIVAPFSGTVEGLTNVVVGATPSRDANDPISFGTLISDEFLVDFSLGAVDVSKMYVGQKVLLTITSFPGAPKLTASVTEISSLPDSSGVAQYPVQALIDVPDNLEIKLREGLLADIEVVEQEVTDVLVVPKSAITYSNGKSTVDVIDTLSEEQLKTLDRLGIIKADSVTESFPTYPVEVSIGLSGNFFVEIKNGLEENMQIVVSKTNSTEAVVGQARIPGAGPQTGSQQNSNRRAQE